MGLKIFQTGHCHAKGLHGLGIQAPYALHGVHSASVYCCYWMTGGLTQAAGWANPSTNIGPEVCISTSCTCWHLPQKSVVNGVAALEHLQRDPGSGAKCFLLYFPWGQQGATGFLMSQCICLKFNYAFTPQCTSKLCFSASAGKKKSDFLYQEKCRADGKLLEKKKSHFIENETFQGKMLIQWPFRQGGFFRARGELVRERETPGHPKSAVLQKVSNGCTPPIVTDYVLERCC